MIAQHCGRRERCAVGRAGGALAHERRAQEGPRTGGAEDEREHDPDRHDGCLTPFARTRRHLRRLAQGPAPMCARHVPDLSEHAPGSAPDR